MQKRRIRRDLGIFMKKRIVPALAGGILITILAGCGQKKDEVVTLSPAVDTAAQSATAETGAAGTTEAAGTTDAADVADETADAADATEAAADTAAVDTAEADRLLEQDYAVCFANLTGQDIVKLQVSFNAGNITNLEVLGEKRLYDGEQYTYQDNSLQALQGATRLKMSVTATAKDATVMLFPEIDILDPAHTNVVLTTTPEGYQMHLQ